MTVNAFIDNNDDGLFGPGDEDIASLLTTTGVVDTPNSIVILRGGHSNRVNGFALTAGKRITLLEGLTAAGKSITLKADTITLNTGADLSAKDITLQAEGDVRMGECSLTASHGTLTIESLHKEVVMYDVNLSGDRINLNTYDAGQPVRASFNTRITAAHGLVNVHSGGEVVLSETRVTGGSITMRAAGSLIAVTDGLVTASGVATFAVDGDKSVFDGQRTTFHVAPDNLVIEAGTVKR